MNPTDCMDRDRTLTRASRPEIRQHFSSTRFDAHSKSYHPDADRHDARVNLTALNFDCTEFQHALAFEMRDAVVAGVASC